MYFAFCASQQHFVINKSDVIALVQAQEALIAAAG